MSRTGRSPVSQEQGLAVCCQVEAVNYVETSAAAATDDASHGGSGAGGVREAFELCALAAMKHARRAPPPPAPAPPTPRFVNAFQCLSL